MIREFEDENLPEWAEVEKEVGWLERRDWELWSMTLVLMAVFASGFLAFLYSQGSTRWLPPEATRFIWLILFGLLILVALLNVYLINRKRFLAKLWRRHIEQAQELEKEREHGVRDPLTQAYNRRFFDEIVPKEVRRCDRTNRPLSLLFVDLDGFKEINRQHGHLVGDQILKDVANALQQCLRTSDLLFRFGGDEFLLVLPETPATGAAVLESRVKKVLSEQKEIHKRVGRPVTISVGCVTYVEGKHFDSVIDEAQRAMEMNRTSRPADDG